MRANVSTIHCDGEDGMCGSWDTDDYQACVSTVNGVLITREQPALGWWSDGLTDLCPEHTRTHTNEREIQP